MSTTSDTDDGQGSQKEPRHKQFPAVEKHFVASENVKQTYQIHVMCPPQLNPEEKRFPVVYATDANASFDMFKGIAWIIQAAGLVRPFILVGIGYPSHSPIAGERLRGRDFTFAGCPDYFSGLPELDDWTDILSPAPGTPYLGGADAFRAFLAEELVPFIDRHYPSAVGDRTYVGHSMGGGFGLHALVLGGSLFNRYVISSPTLWYTGTTPGGVTYNDHDLLLRPMHEFLSQRKSHQEVKLYVSVGSAEEEEPLLRNWRFVSGFNQLRRAFKAASPDWLAWTAEVLQGESHATAWPIAFIHGIQAVFADSTALSQQR
jgi:predicted alpha/beta superfamily hydrolase